jgi:hypothetical protein
MKIIGASYNEGWAYEDGPRKAVTEESRPVERLKPLAEADREAGA